MQIGLRRDNAINYALTDETACAKRDFKLTETRAINSMKSRSRRAFIRKSILPARRLPLPGRFCRAYPVEFEAT